MAPVPGPCLSVKAKPRAVSIPHASANVIVKMRALHEGGHEVFENLSVLSRCKVNHDVTDESDGFCLIAISRVQADASGEQM